MTSPLNLYLFGAFRVEIENTPVRLPTHKAEALLAYLALNPREHSREQLAARFWGDSPDEDARRSLRVALSSIRKQLGNDILLTEQDSVTLNSARPLRVDAHEFSEIREQIDDWPTWQVEAIKAKLDLYRGPLLPDLYDDWVTSLRDDYHALYVTGRLSLIQRLFTQSEYTQAIEQARKLLGAEPANERAHQFLMMGHEALGDRGAALKQFEECKQRLWDELAVEPSAETLEIYNRLKQAPAATAPKPVSLTNLPVPNTSFIGRKAAIQEIKQLLWTTRLLTLTGAGGAGKTRLAIHIGSDLVKAGVFPDGVWWVELAALNDPALVPQAFAKAFGIKELADGAEAEALIYFLKSKHTLFILDNCEHLIESCATLVERLLAQCRDLTVITTSREALNIPGEMVWHVPSLALPQTALRSAAEMAQWEGIQLFNDRASAVSSSFSLTQANAEAVLHICQRLDGIPLAIELAAARLKAISVEQVAARLDDRFRLLTSGSRTALPRQQTLRALIDWSYDLLSSTERLLLQRLAVFAGGCTLEAAEHITGTDPLGPEDVLDLLTRLVDKSLVSVKMLEGGTRYYLLETIRQYGLEKLNQTADYSPLRARHLGYFTNWVEQADANIDGPNQSYWLNRIEADHNNIRTALDWAMHEGGSPIEGMRLAAAVAKFWDTRGYPHEGYERLKALLPQVTLLEDIRLKSKVLYRTGLLAYELMDLDQAHDLCSQAVALSRSTGDKVALADQLWGVGTSAYYRDDLAEARTTMEECVALCRTQPNPYKLSGPLANMGRILQAVGEGDAALATIREGLPLATRINDTWGLSFLHGALGDVLRQQGDLEGAWQAYERSLGFARDLQDSVNMAFALQYLSHLANLRGDYAQSGELAQEGLDWYRRMGYQWGEPFVIRMMGYSALYTGNLVRARELLVESLISNHTLNSTIGVIASLNALAALAAEENKPAPAARLLGAVEALLKANGWNLMAPDLKAFQGTLEAIRAALSAEDRETEWQAGTVLSISQAMQFAMT